MARDRVQPKGAEWYRSQVTRAELDLATERDGQGRPVVMMLSAGQMNDQKGANILAPLLPPARELIADADRIGRK